MRALAVHGLGGGFAYGVIQAGGELSGEVETRFVQATRELNLPERIRWSADRLGEARLSDAYADLVFGCPPCAGFSVAGSGLAQHDNPMHPINDGIRNWFYAVYLAQPTLAVLESVPRTFFSPAGQALWQPLAARYLAGYGLTLASYDNQLVGVPQKRVRTLLWAMRGGCPDVQLPWGQYPTTTGGWNRELHDTAWAIDDLGAPTVGWTVDEEGWGHVTRPLTGQAPDWVMRYVPWGGTARKTAELSFIWEELQRRGRARPSFLWRRLHPSRPAPVLLADSIERTAHYQGPEGGAGDELRYISGRELARLMGYPDSFKLTGHLRRELGPALCQAVSPRVGYWVGTEASRLLEESRPYTRQADPGPTRSGVAYLDLTSAAARPSP